MGKHPKNGHSKKTKGKKSITEKRKRMLMEMSMYRKLKKLGEIVAVNYELLFAPGKENKK